MTKTELSNPKDFIPLLGKELGRSDWMEITQEQINMFADATKDHQWIHVDVERAKKESPFGGPIAHGYLTVSLLPEMVFNVVSVKNVKLVVNYGMNKLRFPAPVPSGSEISASVVVSNVKEIGQDSVEVEYSVTVSVKGAKKPSCVALVLYRYYNEP